MSRCTLLWVCSEGPTWWPGPAPPARMWGRTCTPHARLGSQGNCSDALLTSETLPKKRGCGQGGSKTNGHQHRQDVGLLFENPGAHSVFEEGFDKLVTLCACSVVSDSLQPQGL